MKQRVFRNPFWGMLAVVFILVASPMAQEESETFVTSKDLDIFSWQHVGPWTFSGRITDFAVPGGQS
ncbi:MAG: hypothetical protein GQ544_04400, partial [Candidatus Aminicenantes bacterium]|nr:hypothetical protein [Candidatus Aminicenantes bacterium]